MHHQRTNDLGFLFSLGVPTRDGLDRCASFHLGTVWVLILKVEVVFTAVLSLYEKSPLIEISCSRHTCSRALPSPIQLVYLWSGSPAHGSSLEREVSISPQCLSPHLTKHTLRSCKVKNDTVPNIRSVRTSFAASRALDHPPLTFPNPAIRITVESCCG